MVNFAIRSIIATASKMALVGCTLAASAAAPVRAFPELATYREHNSGTKDLIFQPVQMKSPIPAATATGGWQLLRTPGPEKAGDTVSMMRTADLLNSDPDFAGMMIRCQEKALPQIAFVVVTPFKPRSKTLVTVEAGPAPARFEGIVIGPGSMVALPNEAASLLRVWQTAQLLKVEIAGEDSTVKGTVALAGLAEALDKLETSCPR